jgi:hypothetical protein
MVRDHDRIYGTVVGADAPHPGRTALLNGAP